MELIWELLTLYGWQSVVIAVCTFALIELCKPLARKVVKKEKVRHVLYLLLGYGFTAGLSCGLAAILHRFGDWLTLYGSAMVVVNVLGPIISNAGFFNWLEGVIGGAWSNLSESGQWKKAIKELGSVFGVDEAVLDKIADKVEEEYAPLIKEGAQLFFTENKEELILNLKQKLAGFVENGKLQELAEGLYSKLAAAWKVKEEEKELEEN